MEVSVKAPMCPSRGVLEHVTSRWGVLVLAALFERPYRFSELRREVGGVSEKMLAQTLRTLERDGFVLRDAKPVIPPRVDYSLTAMGREAAEQVWALARWTEHRTADVQRARAAYDGVRTAPGEAVTPDGGAGTAKGEAVTPDGGAGTAHGEARTS